MKNSLKYYGFIIATLACFNFSFAQIVFVSQDFEDPATMDWSLNEIVPFLGTVNSIQNTFIVNNDYTGGFVDFQGFLLDMGNTTDQGYQPNSNYLHTAAFVALQGDEFNNPVLNTTYIDPIFGVNQELICAVTPDYSTLGFTGVDLSYWWFSGPSETGFGTEVYYSIDFGLNWLSVEGPNFAEFTWQQSQIDFGTTLDEQPNVRFAFVFNNGLDDPNDFNFPLSHGFGLDDFRLIADCEEDLGQDFTVCTGELVTLVADTALYDSFSWSTSPDSIGGTLNVLVDQDTTITVISTETGACDATDEITITVNPIRPVLNTTFLSNLNGVDIQCEGQCNGEVSVEVIGGVADEDGNYDISWFDALMNPIDPANITNEIDLNYTSTLSNACAETYFVSVLDEICSTPETTTFTLSSNTEITNIFVGDSVSCFNGSDGSITANPSGGIPPYDFDWGAFGDEQTISGLSIGTYTVVITDNAGCPKSFSYEIEQPNELIVDAFVVSEVSCYNLSDGILSANVFGGTSDYNYVWSHPDFIGVDDAVNNIQTLGNLPPSVGAEDIAQNPDYQSYSDPYTLSVTDNKGCVQTSDIYLIEPPILEVFLTQETLPAYCDNSVIGFNTGYAEVSATGGTPNDDNTYASFVWSLAGETEDNVLYSSIQSVHAGTYFVTATDKRGCVSNMSFEIDLVPTWVAYTDHVDASCFGYNDGSVSIQMEGGCGDPENSCDFNYQWQGGAASGNVLPDVSGLQPGTFSVTVTDNFGCQGVYDVVLGSPDRVDFELTEIKDQSCFTAITSSDDGTVDISVTGGNSPYDVTWINNGTTQGPMTIDDNGIIENLSAGIWQIEVEDSKGCEGTYLLNSLIPNPFEIDEGTEVLADINTDPLFLTETIQCFGDANGQASVLNPNPSFDYTWHLNGSATIIEEGPNSSSLPAGDVIVTASYLLGLCTADSDPVTIDERPSFSIVDVSIPPSCFGDADGQIILTITGATPFLNNNQISDYNFSWSPAELNGQGVTNVDGNLSFNILNQSEGIYYLEVSDKFGCDTVFEVIFSQPDPITFVANTTNLSCNAVNQTADGEVELLVSGGTAPFNYIVGPENNNTGDFVGLGAGNYNVSIVDSKGCSSITSTVNLTQPPVLSTTKVSSSDVLCNGDNTGQIEFLANGGTQDYMFSVTGSASNSTGVFNNLTANDYTLTVTDANGCIANDEVVTLSEPAPLSLVLNATDANCNGNNDGFIDLVVSGGTQPFAYLWSDDSNSEDLNNVSAGSYDVSVTDENGCQQSSGVVVINDLDEVVADWLIVSPGVIFDNAIAAQPAPLDAKFIDVSSYANSLLTEWWIDGVNVTSDVYANPSLGLIEYTFEESGEHYVTMYAINDAGCFDTISFNFVVQGLKEFDAFSPNGDGINDYFFFENFGLSELKASIFNRWGEKIYEMNSTDDKWSGISLNGLEVPAGVYFYVVDAKGEDGTPYQSKGSVSLFR